MILLDLLNALKDSDTLSELLSSSEVDRKIYAYNTKSKADCLVYSFFELTNNKVVCQSTFEVDCYSKEYMKCFKLSDAVKQILITLGDNPFNSDILCIENVGGGYLYNSDLGLHANKIIFKVINKVRY